MRCSAWPENKVSRIQSIGCTWYYVAGRREVVDCFAVSPNAHDITSGLASALSEKLTKLVVLSSMKQKELGKTGVLLPEIGLGTWQYRGGVEPIRKAIVLGSCLVDTAESYCTEEIVGEAVKQLRNRVFIATKVSPRHFPRADVLIAADKSLERLGTDYIDLYQLHWPNCTVPIEETMGAMEELVERGKIRFIGVSNFSVSELRKAQLALSKYRVVSNQVRYSLVDRSLEVDLLRYCAENKITVIAYSPLAHGINHIKEKDPHSI